MSYENWSKIQDCAIRKIQELFNSEDFDIIKFRRLDHLERFASEMAWAALRRKFPNLRH